MLYGGVCKIGFYENRIWRENSHIARSGRSDFLGEEGKNLFIELKVKKKKKNFRLRERDKELDRGGRLQREFSQEISDQLRPLEDSGIHEKKKKFFFIILFLI